MSNSETADLVIRIFELALMTFGAIALICIIANVGDFIGLRIRRETDSDLIENTSQYLEMVRNIIIQETTYCFRDLTDNNRLELTNISAFQALVGQIATNVKKGIVKPGEYNILNGEISLLVTDEYIDWYIAKTAAYAVKRALDNTIED